MDRKFVTTSLFYVLLGFLLGIYMAASKDHSQLTTHAHIMLLGFVVSFIYGVLHKLWLYEVPNGLAVAQFFIHHLGTVVLLIGLFLLYSNTLAEPQIGPILGIASITVLIGAILMVYMFIRFKNNNS